MEIRIDGKGWVTVLGTENWSRALDTTALGEGGHVLEARSWAGDIVSEVQSVNFTVANPPPLKVVVDPAWQAGAILLALLAVGSIVLLARVRRN